MFLNAIKVKNCLIKLLIDVLLFLIVFLIDTSLKIVDDFLPALKFVLDWFVRSKMIKNLCTALYTDDIHFYDKDSGNVTFLCNEMGILCADLSNINLDDTNYDEDDFETIIHIRLSAWHNKSNK